METGLNQGLSPFFIYEQKLKKGEKPCPRIHSMIEYAR